MGYDMGTIYGLSYLEHLIDEIEGYFEYMREEEMKINSKTREILTNILDMLYRETQQMRKTMGLPHL